MPRYFCNCHYLLLTILCLVQCKKAYLPAAISAGNNFLVVDGVINLTPHSVTRIVLTRTQNLGDSVITGIPESAARVTILSGAGTTYILNPDPGDGTYSSDSISLDNNQQYRLEIITRDGRQYSS